MAPPTQVRSRKRDGKLPVYTPAEVAKHCTKDDLWVIIRGNVYNITSFLERHPGGKLSMLDLAGHDATGPFMGFHPPAVIEKRLPQYLVGTAAEDKTTTLQEDLVLAQEALRAEGKFETDMTYYWSKLAWQAALFAVAVGLLVAARGTDASLWLYAASAVAMGVFWQQLAFIGHDFGHNGVFHDRALDSVGGLVVTAFFGVSGQWWRRNHNVHHVVTNSVEHDPDIQHLPLMAISDKLFKGFWSTYYEKMFTLDAVARKAVPYQHYLYLPIMAVARFNLYAQSFILVLNKRAVVPKRALELASLLFFWAWYVSLCKYLLPSAGVVLMYTLLSHAVAGITHVQITLSHFAMPAYNGNGYEISDASSYVRTQLATTMNVECPIWLDWLHGGLQFQVEHHLMPRLPRHNLRYAKEEYIKPLCKKHGVEYHSYSFTECLQIVLGRLADAAAIARNYPEAESENFLVPLLNAEG